MLYIPTCACALILTVSLPNGDYSISISPPRGSSNLDARTGQTQSSFGASCAASCQVVFVRVVAVFCRICLRCNPSPLIPALMEHLFGASTWATNLVFAARCTLGKYRSFPIVSVEIEQFIYSHWSLINKSRVTVLQGLMTAIINQYKSWLMTMLNWPWRIMHKNVCNGKWHEVMKWHYSLALAKATRRTLSMVFAPWNQLDH